VVYEKHEYHKDKGMK